MKPFLRRSKEIKPVNTRLKENFVPTRAAFRHYWLHSFVLTPDLISIERFFTREPPQFHRFLNLNAVIGSSICKSPGGLVYICESN